MRTLNVNLGSRSYPIHIGRGLIEQPQLFKPHIRGSKAVVITNETVAPLYANKLAASLSHCAQVQLHVIPDGETHKTLSTVSAIIDFLISIPCDRKTTIVALGGGVVGDIAGFASACYQRGIPYIQVPTTLLAQVDSSVGGKTGVNHPLGKNMIGAFNQPQCVICDTDTLSTLHVREFRAGMAEVIKYGLVRDSVFFDWLEDNLDQVLGADADSTAYAIEQSCRNKGQVVEDDERESGTRAILNFGHTFGHAIETHLNYSEWLHGEAVSVGMVMAANLSRKLGLLTDSESARINAILHNCGLPISPPSSMTSDNFLRNMSVDKKVENGVIRLILLDGIGSAVIKADYPMAALNATLDESVSA